MGSALSLWDALLHRSHLVPGKFPWSADDHIRNVRRTPPKGAQALMQVQTVKPHLGKKSDLLGQLPSRRQNDDPRRTSKGQLLTACFAECLDKGKHKGKGLAATSPARNPLTSEVTSYKHSRWHGHSQGAQIGILATSVRVSSRTGVFGLVSSQPPQRLQQSCKRSKRTCHSP